MRITSAPNAFANRELLPFSIPSLRSAPGTHVSAPGTAMCACREVIERGQVDAGQLHVFIFCLMLTIRSFPSRCISDQVSWWLIQSGRCGGPFLGSCQLWIASFYTLSHDKPLIEGLSSHIPVDESSRHKHIGEPLIVKCFTCFCRNNCLNCFCSSI
jgi:hypothetical protein